jgi:hypothetical protein
MIRKIDMKGSILRVEESEFVNEFKSLDVRVLDKESVAIGVSRWHADATTGEQAEGYEIMSKFATIYVAPEQARKFAREILKIVGEK